MKPQPKRTVKKTVKAWAEVNKRTGNIKFINDTWYSAAITKKVNSLKPADKGYEILPITITFTVPKK